LQISTAHAPSSTPSVSRFQMCNGQSNFQSGALVLLHRRASGSYPVCWAATSRMSLYTRTNSRVKGRMGAHTLEERERQETRREDRLVPSGGRVVSTGAPAGLNGEHNGVALYRQVTPC